MRHTAILTLLLFFCVMAEAMDEKLERINDIKKNSEYLYGEATMPTQEEAASVAFELLQKEYLNWKAEQSGEQVDSITLQALLELADTIVTRRADMYRVFAYIKKNQTVKKAEPVEPRDSMVTDDMLKKIHSKFFNKPKKEVTAESPSKETPTPSKETPTLSGSVGKEPIAVTRIRKARNFFDLKNILPPLKEEGLITDYGKLATADHLEECYLIIYDPAGNIKALLGKGMEKRPNLNTGSEDSLDNYRGCGAIWFKIKK